jgi:hypothetical protein
MTPGRLSAPQRARERALVKKLSPEMRLRVIAQRRRRCECKPMAWGHYPCPSVHCCSDDPEVRFRAAVDWRVWAIMSDISDSDFYSAIETAVSLAHQILDERQRRIDLTESTGVIDLESCRGLRRRRHGARRLEGDAVVIPLHPRKPPVTE